MCSLGGGLPGAVGDSRAGAEWELMFLQVYKQARACRLAEKGELGGNQTGLG